MTVFNGTREIQVISLLWEVNSNKKDTNVCHETVIIFQCIQIRKLDLELVKILRLSWSTCVN